MSASRASFSSMLTKFLFSPAARRDRIVCCLARPVGHLDIAMFAQGTGTTVVAATAWKRTPPAPSGIASPLDPPRRTVTRRGRVYLVGGGMVEVVAQTLVLAPPDPTSIPSPPPFFPSLLPTTATTTQPLLFSSLLLLSSPPPLSLCPVSSASPPQEAK